MSGSFRVGQKVVCVLTPKNNFAGLKCGEIYEISAIGLFSQITGEPLVRIKEHGTQCYWARRFRPAVKRKTDISIFKEILADADNYKVRELAE